MSPSTNALAAAKATYQSPLQNNRLAHLPDGEVECCLPTGGHSGECRKISGPSA
jgi:hypothetical protein